uniref:Fungal lipase-like domain-containing protein n=1 Tax=Spongospora subterranea TaxID=70186 RepID=A0A0H5R8L4_9EUKA|eukprot:CRZ04699.1 hypothetical protein [Spongospora subterranea]
MFCETRVLKCGGVCSSTVWKALCLEHTGTIPFFSISKRIEHLRKTHWPAQKTAPTLFITGQGFGGSIAELFLYLKLGKTIDCPMAAYTFGALGVGDFKYRADFQQRRGRQSFKSSGLRSAGKVVKLSCSATKRRSSTPVFIVDLGICLKDVKKWFISCNVWEKMRSAVYGDEQASSYLIYWFWANAPKPFSSHSAIAYFHNLTHGSVEL